MAEEQQDVVRLWRCENGHAHEQKRTMDLRPTECLSCRSQQFERVRFVPESRALEAEEKLREMEKECRQRREEQREAVGWVRELNTRLGELHAALSRSGDGDSA